MVYKCTELNREQTDTHKIAWFAVNARYHIAPPVFLWRMFAYQVSHFQYFVMHIVVNFYIAVHFKVLCMLVLLVCFQIAGDTRGGADENSLDSSVNSLQIEVVSGHSSDWTRETGTVCLLQPGPGSTQLCYLPANLVHTQCVRFMANKLVIQSHS